MDIGQKRIGVALSDPGGILASPFAILESREEGLDAAAVVALAREHEVGMIVVGLPRSMDGTSGRQAAIARSFAARLRQATDVPVVLRDERLSTVSAKRALAPGRRRKPGEKLRYDAAAAAIVLQGYLEEQRRPELDGPPTSDEYSGS